MRRTGNDISANAVSAIGVAVLMAVAGLIWLAKEPLRIWHTTGADGQMHPDGATWAVYGTAGGLIMAVMMVVSIRAAGKREPPPPIAEAYRIADVLAPACGHPLAVRVTNDAYPGETLAWLCPHCDAVLDAACGALPRACCPSVPGDTHWETCRYAAAWNELNAKEG